MDNQAPPFIEAKRYSRKRNKPVGFMSSIEQPERHIGEGFSHAVGFVYRALQALNMVPDGCTNRCATHQYSLHVVQSAVVFRIAYKCLQLQGNHCHKIGLIMWWEFFKRIR